MKKLFSLFFPKWQLKEVYRGNWTINHHEEFTNKFLHTSEDFCVFEIMYSPTRNEWKLQMSGRTPKNHPKYPEVVKRLNELRLES